MKDKQSNDILTLISIEEEKRQKNFVIGLLMK